jgi:predicted TIM-barrel fold metal-dependent hydrolase
MTVSDDLARTIATGGRPGFDTRDHLDYAKRQARERNLENVLIIDVDAHHYELESWPDIVKYIEDPVIRHSAEQGIRRGRHSLLTKQNPGRQDMAGRVTRYSAHKEERTPPGVPRDVTLLRREMQAIGIDYQVVFPNSLLELGLHPDPLTETQVSWAYCRWLTEEILPHDPRIKTFIYLPFNDAEASLRHVEQFADKPGVVGFMVSSSRYTPVHDNVYVPVYRAIEETGKVLTFHGGLTHQNRVFEGMNKFISVHSLAFVLFNMVHMTNMIINGIPERFPKLKIIWAESGLAWLPFMAQRLDNEYGMRSSEAPLLRKKPSEYIRENFWYSSQPIETGNLEALELTMQMIGAETQLLFSSDYPHWDFNLPSTIFDLPFLSEQAKRNILGENAKALLGLADAVPSGHLDDAE